MDLGGFLASNLVGVLAILESFNVQDVPEKGIIRRYRSLNFGQRGLEEVVGH
jgi:hypothetical protein